MKKRKGCNILFVLFLFFQISSACAAGEENTVPEDQTMYLNESFWTTPENYLQDKKEMIFNILKTPASAEDVPFNVVAIGKDDLEYSPSRNPSEALQNLPTVFIGQGGDFIQPATASILGSDTNHTKVVIDDIELNTQVDGTFDLSLLQTENLESIQVSNGPLSPLWGSSLGGVIYFKTLDPVPGEKQPVFKLRSSYGSFNTYKNSMEASFNAGKASFLLIPSWIETEGSLPGGESRRGNYSLKGKYGISEELFLDLTSGYADADIGEYEQPRFGRRTELDTRFFYSGLKATYQPYQDKDSSLKASLLLNGYRNTLERRYYALQDEIPEPYMMNAAWEIRTGARANITYEKEKNIYSLEGNVDETSFEVTDFPDRKNVTSSYLSLNAEHPFTDNISGTSYLRYDENSAFDGEASFGAGVNIKDIQKWNVRAVVSRDFNAPPLYDRYIDLPERGIKSNKGLGAETAVTFRLSLEREIIKDLLLQVNPYYQKLEDGILLTLDPNDELYFYKNHESITRKGIEAGLLWSLCKNTVVRLGADFNDIVNEDTDEVVEGNGRIRYTASMETKLSESWVVNVSGYYVWWDMPEIYNAKDRNFVFNGKVTHVFSKDISVYAAIYNIFDQDLYWIDVFPNPPRSYEAGFAWKF
jgi:vitamin B12 transporter